VSQRKILKSFGLINENIYCDVKFAKNTEDCSELNRLLKFFNPENKQTLDDLKELKVEN
jgi:hypothetical protein